MPTERHIPPAARGVGRRGRGGARPPPPQPPPPRLSLSLSRARLLAALAAVLLAPCAAAWGGGGRAAAAAAEVSFAPAAARHLPSALGDARPAGAAGELLPARAAGAAVGAARAAAGGARALPEGEEGRGELLREATLAANGVPAGGAARARALSEAAPRPLRLRPVLQLGGEEGAEGGLSAEARAFVERNVLPAALATAQRLMDVRAPVQGRLHLPVQCAIPWSFPPSGDGEADGDERVMCASVRDITRAPFNTCGAATVPAEYYGEATTCDCAAARTRDECACVTAPAGEGVADADTLVFITTEECPGESGTLAVAGHCFVDPLTNRPLAGYVTLCASRVEEHVAAMGGAAAADAGAAAWGTWMDTLVHELMHVVAFSGTLFPTWYNHETGGAWGNQAIVTVAYENGWMPYGLALATPAVRREAATLLGCAAGADAIPGVPVENQGAEGTTGSHWEMRAVGIDELMTGSTLPTRQTVSRLTLAALEDTGWYNPRYEEATEVADSWGGGAGCDFFWKDCTNLSNDGRYFCDTSNEDQRVCTAGGAAIGACVSTPLLDGCGVRMPYSNGPCSDASTLRPAAEFWGASYGESAACVPVDDAITWERVGGSIGLDGVPANDAQGGFVYTREAGQATCMDVRCNDEGTELTVVIGNDEHPCPEGEYVEMADIGAAFSNGRIGPCPAPTEVCERVSCGAGKGDAFCGSDEDAGHCGAGGECACFLGHAGARCTETLCFRDPYPGAPNLCPEGTTCDRQAGVCRGGPMPPPNASPPQRLTGTEDEPMIIPELTEEGDSVIDKLGILGLPPLAVLGAIIGMLMCCIGIAAGCIMQQGRVDEAEKRRSRWMRVNTSSRFTSLRSFNSLLTASRASSRGASAAGSPRAVVVGDAPVPTGADGAGEVELIVLPQELRDVDQTTAAGSAPGGQTAAIPPVV